MGNVRQTTLADVDRVLGLRNLGYPHGEIVQQTGLAPNTVTRILDGWRPVGRKPVRLTRNVHRRGPKP